MILFPNAKINLGLDILFKRDDSYHEIETVMIPVGWQDILEIVPAKNNETTLTVTGRTVDCPPEKNLVMKAYRKLAETIDIPPVDIYLRKIIPDGAGLGGGSADAAFTLTGLNDLFSLGLSQDKLAHIAAAIGADCPFFIYNRPMLCTGTGTTMSPIDINISELSVVIIKPAVSVPTAMAYSRVKPSIPSISLGHTIQLPPEKWHGQLKNDFEPSVFPLLPQCGDIKTRLQSSGAIYSSMSGSGSAVYGLFKSDILAEDISHLFPECDIWTGRLLLHETL